MVEVFYHLPCNHYHRCSQVVRVCVCARWKTSIWLHQHCHLHCISEPFDDTIPAIRVSKILLLLPFVLRPLTISILVPFDNLESHAIKSVEVGVDCWVIWRLRSLFICFNFHFHCSSLQCIGSSSSESICWVLALYKTGTTTTTLEIVSFSLVC